MSLSSLFAFIVGFLAFGVAGGWLLRSRRARAEGEAQALAADQSVQSMTAQFAAQAAEREGTIEALRRDLAESQTGRARAEEQATRLPELREGIATIEAQREQLRERLQSVERELAQATANLENERRQSTEKLALLTSAREDLTLQFKTLASDILEEKSKRFTAENQASIGHLLDPLNTRLKDFQAKVEEVQKEGIAGRSELKTQIGGLMSLSERVSSDATNLANALKGSSKIQGDWGELMLERILDGCGLRKGHEYRVQQSFAAAEGKRGRPDVIIDLRDGCHLVIDAKLSLVDYNDYCNCDDERKREASLSRHMASFRGHMKELAGRNYQSLYGLKSLDFVVMFVPIEPAFLLAISRDQKLWEDAWSKSILLVSPSTLPFVLRTVANLWRQETQARRVQEIVDKGRDLYDKLASFAKDLAEVGGKLNAARDSYDEAVKKLSTGKGNAIRQAEMLKELGVKPTKSLPAAMLDASLDGSPDMSMDVSLNIDDGGERELLTSLAAADTEYLPDPLDELATMKLAATRRPALTPPAKISPQKSIFDEFSAVH